MLDIPFGFDWGDIFVESFNTKERKATIIYNFNFDSIDLIEDIFSYCVGHIFWVNKNIIKDSSIDVIFDLRGRHINSKDIEEFRKLIKNHLFTLDKSLKVEFVIHR
jgi:hypothetical protein